VESTVINYFYRQNRKIWTPWMAKFALMTATKCLYSNLPSNVSLVSNFRDAGENYAHSKGPLTDALDMNMLNNAIHWVKKQVHVAAFVREKLANDGTRSEENSSGRYLRNLFLSVFHYPSMDSMASWQIDFNQRRAGVLVGPEKLYKLAEDHFPREVAPACTINEPSHGQGSCAATEISLFVRHRTDMVRWFSDTVTMCPFLFYCGTVRQTPYAVGRGLSEQVLYGGRNLLMSLEWHHIDVIVRQLLLSQVSESNAKLVHVGISPLLPVLLTLFPRNELIVHNDGAGGCSGVMDSLIKEQAYSFSSKIAEMLAGYDQFRCRESVTALHAAETTTDVLMSDIVLVLPMQESPGEPQQRQVREAMNSLVHRQQVDYILALGSCASAPTTLHFRGSDFATEVPPGNGQTRTYYVVEDICLEGNTDVGGILYRLVRHCRPLPCVSLIGRY
jgi:hypothetical protein